ncbi:hypothetical protein OG21DRAFT_810170 [Imleria badia]|nr:hypothetical protein OG21DRAFT_810170 [Imleria badia]
MAEFLWRFDHLSPKQRGHDVSIQPANLAAEVDARVREQLGMKDKKIPLYMYEVPGLDGTGYAYGPRPPTQNRSLVSRCTRNLPVYWIPVEDVDGDSGSYGQPGEQDADAQAGQDKAKKGPWSEPRVIYMKDTWRFLSDLPDVEVKAEHEIYAILHEHGTPNIPEHVAGGDVDGGRTQAQYLVDAPWLCVKPRISPYQHYRLVHRIVGRPLFKFECTKQLVTAVFDALKAHSHAFTSAKILHRDISAGNIILTDDGSGLLIDWELAKLMKEVGSRRPDRTGTWQFMSANLLQHPGKMHTFSDDLESFLHVLGWMMLRYVPASDVYDAEDRGHDMLKFDEHSVRKRRFDHGGGRKRDALGAGNYPSTTFGPKCETPLTKLLRKLMTPFKSLYGDPPTEEDRRKINVDKSKYDDILDDLSRNIRQYDRNVQCLSSPTWFINEIKMVLDGDGWPTNDAADLNLPIASGDETDRQMKIKTSQLQDMHSMIQMSKAPSMNSKRAASPTPEPSAKRRRGTPDVSGSGI